MRLPELRYILAGARGLSQTLNRPHDRRGPALFSGFVDLQEAETDRQQPVLLAHRPGAHEPKALS